MLKYIAGLIVAFALIAGTASAAGPSFSIGIGIYPRHHHCDPYPHCRPYPRHCEPHIHLDLYPRHRHHHHHNHRHHNHRHHNHRHHR